MAEALFGKNTVLINGLLHPIIKISKTLNIVLVGNEFGDSVLFYDLQKLRNGLLLDTESPELVKTLEIPGLNEDTRRTQVTLEQCSEPKMVINRMDGGSGGTSSMYVCDIQINMPVMCHFEEDIVYDSVMERDLLTCSITERGVIRDYDIRCGRKVLTIEPPHGTNYNELNSLNNFIYCATNSYPNSKEYSLVLIDRRTKNVLSKVELKHGNKDSPRIKICSPYLWLYYGCWIDEIRPIQCYQYNPDLKLLGEYSAPRNNVVFGNVLPTHSGRICCEGLDTFKRLLVYSPTLKHTIWTSLDLCTRSLEIDGLDYCDGIMVASMMSPKYYDRRRRPSVLSFWSIDDSLL